MIAYLVHQASDARDDPSLGTLVMVVYADSPEAALVDYERGASSVTNFDRGGYAKPEATPLHVGSLYCV